MCGIIGIIAKDAVAPGLIEGLRRLEYRGYDSAGIATLVDGRIECRRAEGKLVNLARRLDHEPVRGVISRAGRISGSVNLAIDGSSAAAPQQA